MKNRLSLLLASTALTVAIGLPALAAMQDPVGSAGLLDSVRAAVLGDGDQPMPLVRVSGDDNDDDDDDDDDDCEDDDDDCKGAGARGNPAPAGTVAPPANGLFGNGKPPVAVTN